ncbi:hypothetical protein B0I35DRAFT_409710 [Stachybotrys elegans]|uniref:Uncharacterized protein n=1 Tax=Stachybotrys elegans TaxID=80388 RepID=A0A8K0SM14_9HYPO|nr:hypothetical protein B0I35DRAFT_409710 [Stachybotrys elegans]
MTGTIAIPQRYTVADLETASIRSAAPSYISSEVPSYHSTVNHQEAAPAYTPRATTTTSSQNRRAPPSRPETSNPRQQTIGLPPIPPAPALGVPNLHNFRMPSFSTSNSLANRHYHNVAERRVLANRLATDVVRKYTVIEPPAVRHRPLEDPYLVGEEAAAIARRERLAREAGDDILIREDRQWDWWLARMKDHEERERTFVRGRRGADHGQRKKLLHRIGGRMLA